METDAKELEDWRRLIEDGDWRIKELWNDFSEDTDMSNTPLYVRAFMAWIVRGGEWDNWEDENPPRKNKSSLPKMGVDGAGLKMISKLGEKK